MQSNSVDVKVFHNPVCTLKTQAICFTIFFSQVSFDADFDVHFGQQCCKTMVHALHVALHC